VDFFKIKHEGLLCVNLCMFNPWALELNTHYTLQKIQDLNGCYLPAYSW
jgi:hypothetical protein